MWSEEGPSSRTPIAIAPIARTTPALTIAGTVRRKTTGIRRPLYRTSRAFSGKVETGFPSENAINAKKLEQVQFPLKLNLL
jgi:hypothetical protein